MSGPSLPAAGPRRPGDPLGLVPRDAGWVRRYILAELFERPAAVRRPPRRGVRPLPSELLDAPITDHPKL